MAVVITILQRPTGFRFAWRVDNAPERIHFTMNGDEVLLIAVPKHVDLIAN